MPIVNLNGDEDDELEKEDVGDTEDQIRREMIKFCDELEKAGRFQDSLRIHMAFTEQLWKREHMKEDKSWKWEEQPRFPPFIEAFFVVGEQKATPPVEMPAITWTVAIEEVIDDVEK